MGIFLVQCLISVHHIVSSWWRHQMETFFALLALCAKNSPVTGEFPPQRPVTRSFDVFFYLHQIKRLSEQSWGWWLRRHRAQYDDNIMYWPLSWRDITVFGSFWLFLSLRCCFLSSIFFSNWYKVIQKIILTSSLLTMEYFYLTKFVSKWVIWL